MKKFEARVTKLRQTPGLDADPDVRAWDGDHGLEADLLINH